MLAPNKQNLLLLKSQTKLVNNGLKLLKEKRSGLIFTFLEFSHTGKELEKKVSKEVLKILEAYDLSISFISVEELLLELEEVAVMRLSTEKKRVSGVYIDKLEVDLIPPLRNYLKRNVRHSLTSFANFFPILLELTQLKLNVIKIAQEIKKVSRQVSNLERKIDDINFQIKKMKDALMEKENYEKAVSIKLFK